MALSALVACGVGFAASTVASGVIDSTGIRSMMGQGGVLLDWAGFFRVDECITIVLSAWAGRKITDAARVHLASLPSRGK
jgi:hypothetical protein